MSDLRQALLGILVALISSGIVLGSIALALTEGRKPLAQVPLPTSTMNPLLLTPVDTPAPGEPTFTSSPSPLPPLTLTLQPTPRCQPPLGWRQVDILPGDTLELLAELYGIPLEELRQGNCLPNGELQPGTFIFAPGQTPTPTWTATQTATPEPPQSQPSQAKKQPPRCGPPGGWVIYYVRRGDTLSRISVLTHTTVAQLQKANCLGSSTTIRVGQRLYVPHLPPIQVPTRTPTRRPPTATPTHLPAGTWTPTATSTPVPTDTPTYTPLPSNTPLPSPTDAPPPTDTPLPTSNEAPTDTPVSPGA